ncbi:MULTISPECIES: AMP nucleosidase [unclassified Corynebacterium]|uniref:AMP nucleosidase n=1 Tax=unclassified Corynebacterium TaxID=2624378 RepID=UPI001B32B03A|nr:MULTISPECIES: AMP nucleosidase [unclassified Corynebacterium]MBP3948372.1 AMP nucleosidase [Corynebacterium sp. Marseille-P3884]MCT1450871.1 AMP nucleosidase [Corynebacterium sp. p3-SID1194]
MGALEVVGSVDGAVDKLIELYAAACERARGGGDYAQVLYPKIAVEIKEWKPIDRSEPFGYVDEAGVYSAALSRPDLMSSYLRHQLRCLTDNYDAEISVGYSDIGIAPEYIRGAKRGTDATIPRPTLDDVHDAIIDGDWDAFHGPEKPLFHFGPQRFDIACARIEHYTGIEVDSVQKFILFTNYEMHTREFVKFGLSQLADDATRYNALILPNGTRIERGDVDGIDALAMNLASKYQMPRFDLVADGNSGVTMINIGVGPSNAKTITDCLAVLRPECWIMIGHCAGLDARMRIGDLILGNAYERRDHVLHSHIDPETPIPAVPEIQRTLEKSVKRIYGEEEQSLMRTGTVLSTDDRNWEWQAPRDLWEWLRNSTAAAVDMESSTIAANGYRYRVPYGTLLAVSDLPLHAVPKLPAAAQAFYSNSKEAHVMCAVRAVERLAKHPERLRTRKLRRAQGEVPFR